jgi:hypothetical protein
MPKIMTAMKGRVTHTLKEQHIEVLRAQQCQLVGLTSTRRGGLNGRMFDALTAVGPHSQFPVENKTERLEASWLNGLILPNASLLRS